MPRISLLVTCYNAAEYIGECIESVKAQTFEDWECLIGDDCSTDGTREAILAAIGEDKRFRPFVHQANKGGGENLRFLMGEATGDVCVELGGDDFLATPEALARIVAEYDEHPDCEATSGSFVCTPRGGVLNHKPDVLWWRRWCHCKPLTWKRSVGQRALAELGEVMFDEDGEVPRYGWDVAVYLPIRYLARSYRTIHDVLYAYREHPQNDAKSHRADQIATETRVAEWLDKRLMPESLPWLAKERV